MSLVDMADVNDRFVTVGCAVGDHKRCASSIRVTLVTARTGKRTAPCRGVGAMAHGAGAGQTAGVPRSCSGSERNYDIGLSLGGAIAAAMCGSPGSAAVVAGIARQRVTGQVMGTGVIRECGTVRAAVRVGTMTVSAARTG